MGKGIGRRAFGAGAVAMASMGGAWRARAASPGVKIGLLSDFSSVYADSSGKGSLEAIRMTVDEFGGQLLGQPVQVISADHMNKADVGAGIARRWLDQEDVDVIVDVNNSAVAFAVKDLVEQKQRVALFVGAGSSDLTGKHCSPNTVHTLYDTTALARSTVKAMNDLYGPKRWFFLTGDFAFGQSLEKDARSVIEPTGGKVVGRVAVPLGTNDFASYLLQAQSSGADLIGVAVAGADLARAVKQGAEFGIAPRQKFVASVVTEHDIYSIGPKAAGGMVFSSPFYWDLDDETRAWSKRFQQRTGKLPTMTQAGNASAVLHYLKAVRAADSKEAMPVMAQMRALPVQDFMTKSAPVRIDGRVERDMHVFQAKNAAESTGGWDIYKFIKTNAGKDVVRPASEGNCPLVKS
jgi:branched-chain amino acid transport system substrate-binding protein